MKATSTSSLWHAFDHLIDAVFICSKDGSLHYANESFFTLCETGQRIVRGHRDVREVLTLPLECWAPLSAFEFEPAYQEVSFSTAAGAEGCVQVLAQRLPSDPEHADLFLYILHDVTIEVRLHQKYRAQITENERLIQQLERNLKKSDLIREIALKYSTQTRCDVLLATLAVRMKETFGFVEVEFFTFAQTADSLTIDSSGRRLGSRMRTVLARLTEKGMQSLPKANKCSRLEVERLGSFILCQVEPKLESPYLLVIGLTQEQESQNFDPVVSALCEQLESLLDNRALQIAATTDPLTGVFNRRYFDSRMIIECRRAGGGRHPLTLLLFDIDHFKNVNDRYGHPAGDEVLKVLGRILKNSSREDDIPVRLGGEEFALLLPGNSADDSVILAERIRKTLSETEVPLPDRSGTIKVTTSVGIAEVTPTEATPDQLYKAADKALYQAKTSGRNRTVRA
jgi:diguanylate cyclase (GGDEF)-like protein